MGSHAFHSHNPHSAMRGIFFQLPVKNATSKKRWFERRLVLFLF